MSTSHLLSVRRAAGAAVHPRSGLILARRTRPRSPPHRFFSWLSSHPEPSLKSPTLQANDFFSPSSHTAFLPRFHPNYKADSNNSKATEPDDPSNPDPHRLVSDREWELRVGSGILHLRAMVPHILDSSVESERWPASVFSKDIALVLPPPLPVKVRAQQNESIQSSFLAVDQVIEIDTPSFLGHPSQIMSLPLYSLTFTLARHGLHALHSDIQTSIERFTVSAAPTLSTPSGSEDASKASPLSRRQRQVRILLKVTGTSRLGSSTTPTIWQTSSLFSFCPISGLIAEHKVETIRPLPGEGVAEWLRGRLMGHLAGAGASAGGVVAPGGTASNGGVGGRGQSVPEGALVPLRFKPAFEAAHLASKRVRINGRKM